MYSTYFTSDLHFNHAKIIEYCNRPYSTTEDMNEDLIKRWNAKIKPTDTVYNLGDVMWGSNASEILPRLNGKKVLIMGNHDRRPVLQPYFESIYQYFTLKLGKENLVLMHYPIASWDRQYHGSIHLHGHSHGTWDNTGTLRFDVGVDCWNMNPVSLSEILALVPQRKQEASDAKKAEGSAFKDLYDRAEKDLKK